MTDEWKVSQCDQPWVIDDAYIPAAPAYGVYISQMIRYSRDCGSYQDFFDRGLLLTRKLLNQGFLLVKLKSSLRKFYGRHHDLVDRYGISASQITMMSDCMSLTPLSIIFQLYPGSQFLLVEDTGVPRDNHRSARSH